MRSHLAALLLLASAPVLAGGPQTVASGEGRVRLLELYTSEGCSSCPPADRFISKLTGDPRLWREIVPVAFHVDYWNYIGWPDRFADPVFTKRQRAHAASGRVRSVYTPGFVLGGDEWQGFFRGRKLPAGGGERVGPLEVTVDGDRYSARFAPSGRHGPLELHVALLGFDLSTEVRAGENRGRRLEHDFVVLGYTRADLGAAGSALAAAGRMPEAIAEAPRTALAAWVTEQRDTLPIQSAGGWLSEP